MSAVQGRGAVASRGRAASRRGSASARADTVVRGAVEGRGVTASRSVFAPGRRRPRRVARAAVALLVTVLALVAGALGTPGTASAHGGYQVMSVTKGAYSVTVRARPYVEGGVSKIDVTSYLVRQDIGESDLAAHITLQLAGPNGSLTLKPPIVGDGYQAIINAPQNAWRHWTITAHVTGAAGSTTVTGAPLGDPPGEPGWLIPASVVVALIAIALLIVGRRRRAALPDDEDDDESWD